MSIRHASLRLTLCSATLLALAACGGGGGDSTATPTTPAASTTNVSTKVIDGAIQNALVCLDKNGNGKCDTGEVQGKTDASGAVTLAVPNADVGKYPIIAVVGTDAVDADHGAVTRAYTMSAPADQVGIVSPLTTLVQQTVATTGSSTAEAAKTVQQSTGISASLFQDFTTATAPNDGSVSAATVARMLVVTTQQQSAAVASTVGTTAVDGAAITQADIDKAIQKKLLELLPALVTALSDPAVLAASTPAAKEQALAAAAAALITDSGLTPAAVATVVAINNQTSNPPATTTTPPPTAGFNLHTLTFTDAQNYFYRVLTGSVAQNTPDSNNNTRYVDRRVRASGGNLAKWGPGTDPARATDMHWNGSAWVNCPINFANVSSVRDAQGNSVYNFCDNAETGKSNRATFDIGGKTMASVYAQVRAAGYTNLTLADPAVLAADTFPTGSSLLYQTTTSLTTAVSYYPAGVHSPIGTSNLVTQYSAAVSAGGVASTQASDAACNSAEANTTSGTNSTTLEGLISTKKGTPCIYNPSSFVYAGVTYASGDTNQWWSNSTLSLGKLGTAPINSGTAPGFYTTNTPLRVAFTGSGNGVTYYACKERFNNGSVRNCSAIGTGTYTITTLGDARAMTFNNLPAQTGALNYTRVFVERGGVIYFGYQSKPGVFNTARLAGTAASALMTKLGLPIEDPSVPLALTAGSYAGTWDFHDPVLGVTANNGITLYVNPNGSTSCEEHGPSRFYACSLTVTNPATGAFTLTDATTTLTGTFNFTAGTMTGTMHDPSSTPVDGPAVGGRR